jgi:hypothetical protein
VGLQLLPSLQLGLFGLLRRQLGCLLSRLVLLLGLLLAQGRSGLTARLAEGVLPWLRVRLVDGVRVWLLLLVPLPLQSLNVSVLGGVDALLLELLKELDFLELPVLGIVGRAAVGVVASIELRVIVRLKPGRLFDLLDLLAFDCEECVI